MNKKYVVRNIEELKGELSELEHVLEEGEQEVLLSERQVQLVRLAALKDVHSHLVNAEAAFIMNGMDETLEDILFHLREYVLKEL